MPPAEHKALLAQSVADFVGRASDIARVRALRGSAREYDRQVWQRIAELGWLGITVPERYGGTGLGLTEAAIVAEGLARVLAPEPYTAAAVLAPTVLEACPSETLKREMLPAIASGERIVVLAWQEIAGALDGAHVLARATPFEGGFRIEGTKRYVVGAAGADSYLIAARSPEGVVLACVDRDTAGVSVSLQPLADGRNVGTIELHDVVVRSEHVAGMGDAAAAALARGIDRAAAVAGAELHGVMSRALEMSVEYMKTRVQFGRPIGSFQALQHRAVDLYLQQQLSSAVLEESLPALDGEPAPSRRAAIASRVKARCSEAAVRVTRESIQIHGAIGFTDEYDAGLFLKRALVLSAWLGNATQHRRRYAAVVLGDA